MKLRIDSAKYTMMWKSWVSWRYPSWALQILLYSLSGNTFFFHATNPKRLKKFLRKRENKTGSWGWWVRRENGRWRSQFIGEKQRTWQLKIEMKSLEKVKSAFAFGNHVYESSSLIRLVKWACHCFCGWISGQKTFFSFFF